MPSPHYYIMIGSQNVPLVFVFFNWLSCSQITDLTTRYLPLFVPPIDRHTGVRLVPCFTFCSTTLARPIDTTLSPTTMPPKASSNAADTAPLIDLFKSIGLTQAKAAEAAKNPKSATIFKDLIEKYALVGKLDEKQAGLVAALAVQQSKSNVGEEEKSYVVNAILDGRLKSVDQVNGTFALTV